MTTKDYNYALSMTSQIYFCGIPFRLDTTPKCELNCLYCFAMARGGRKTNTNLRINIDWFMKKLVRTFDHSSQDVDVNGELLRSRLPIHLGGMSDPFSDYETALVSDQLLIALAKYQYPVVLSTKNTDALLRAERRKKLKLNRNLIVQISIPFYNQATAQILEKRCPRPSDRIAALSVLTENNIATSVRVQPLFPGNEQEVAEELIPAIAKTGCKHVITEYLKLAVEKNISNHKKLFTVIGWDILSYYRDQGARTVGREWILPNEFRWKKLQPIIKSIQSEGMTWGAADYGLTHLGDTDCCCGLDKFAGFEHWFTPNFSNIIRKADIGPLMYTLENRGFSSGKSIRRYINSDCRIDGNQSVLSYLLHKWNKPGTENAPDSFLGVHFDGEYDGAGNAVYRKCLVERIE